MGRDHETIRARAYDIWNRDGRQEGRDEEYWLQAERELSASGTTGETTATGMAGQAAALPSETPAPLQAKKADGAAKAVVAKAAAPRKRRGSQPLSQA